MTFCYSTFNKRVTHEPHEEWNKKTLKSGSHLAKKQYIFLFSLMKAL